MCPYDHTVLLAAELLSMHPYMHVGTHSCMHSVFTDAFVQHLSAPMIRYVQSNSCISNALIGPKKLSLVMTATELLHWYGLHSHRLC